MGVRLVVFNDETPEVAITLTHTAPGAALAQGWRGTCTECGKPVHYWTESKAFEGAQAHVNSHKA